MHVRARDKRLTLHSGSHVAALLLVRLRLSISWCHALGQLTCCQPIEEAELWFE